MLRAHASPIDIPEVLRWWALGKVSFDAEDSRRFFVPTLWDPRMNFCFCHGVKSGFHPLVMDEVPFDEAGLDRVLDTCTRDALARNLYLDARSPVELVLWTPKVFEWHANDFSALGRLAHLPQNLRVIEFVFRFLPLYVQLLILRYTPERVVCKSLPFDWTLLYDFSELSPYGRMSPKDKDACPTAEVRVLHTSCIHPPSKLERSYTSKYFLIYFDLDRFSYRCT